MRMSLTASEARRRGLLSEGQMARLLHIDRVEAREMPWTRESFAHVRSIVDANERIGDLAGIARRLKERNERLEARVARLREAQGSTTLPSRVLRKIRG